MKKKEQLDLEEVPILHYCQINGPLIPDKGLLRVVSVTSLLPSLFHLIKNSIDSNLHSNISVTQENT